MHGQRLPMVSSVRRDAWLEIDLNAIEHNINIIRSWLKSDTMIMAIVKSDAYGHGAVPCADLLQALKIDWLAVASVDEGCQLRQSGISLPILLLSPCPKWALETAFKNDLTLTLSSLTQIEEINDASLRNDRKTSVHLKLDTGMHRLGVQESRLNELLNALQKAPGIKLEGVFSHLAKADESGFTALQVQCLERCLKTIRQCGFHTDLIHLSSSESTRLYPWTHYNMVRVGINLYGLEPKSKAVDLIPALTLKARINQVQQIEANEGVGYGLSWQSQEPSIIASVPVGYADGVDRGLSNKLHGLLQGVSVPQVGRISMDQMLFDVSAVPGAQEGDVITLIGSENTFISAGCEDQIFLADWAEKIDTITYELSCRLRIRMPRVYTRRDIANKNETHSSTKSNGDGLEN